MENYKDEIWKLIELSNNIYISNYGRIKFYKNGKLIIRYKDLPLDKDGYYRYSFRRTDGKNSYEPIHRLVAKAFIENPLNKPCVNHKDSNRLNNHVSNLEWVTCRENVYHSYQYGNRKKCLDVPKVSKLTPYQISQIPILRQYYSLKKISELFNISYTSIKNIVIKLKRLSNDNQQPSIYENNYISEGSTTISKESTLQADGNGKALHSKKNEDIVSSL